MLGLFCERRVQPERQYKAEKEESVFVPKEVLECVGFIYCRLPNKREPQPFGTVFFVNLRDKEFPTMGWPYAITAKHVIDAIRKKSADDIVYFRINRKGGNAKLIETKLKNWRFHPTDHTVDVAVLPFEPPFKEFDIRVFQSDGFATSEVIVATDDVIAVQDDSPPPPVSKMHVPVGTGDEVFIAGLFAERLGIGRNIPIVRVGNIAAMAGEPVKTPFGDVVVHLIEVRSIGGLSGSPVFVHLGNVRKVGNQILFSTGTAGVFYLFGLVHGHWDEQQATTKQNVNMGIAMVVPIKKILEVLRQPALKEQREREKEEVMAKRNMPKLDTRLIARAVDKLAIGEPLTEKKKPVKRVKKTKKYGAK